MPVCLLGNCVHVHGCTGALPEPARDGAPASLPTEPVLKQSLEAIVANTTGSDSMV